jgi:hypothetical protein
MDWQPIETIPPAPERIWVKTYSGIVCLARVNGGHGEKPYIKPATPQYPKRRVMCFRVDKSGDVAAVAWSTAPREG